MRQLFERALLNASAERRAELLAGAAALAAPAIGFDGDAAPVDAPFSVLHGIYWLTANLACEAPVLLAVDDAHWADVASLRALAYLAGRLDGLPVTIVATVRTGEPRSDGRLLDELAVAAHDVLRPAPLSPAGIAALLRTPPESDLVAAAERATGGNPFLLEEFARADDPRGDA